jgi:hypothetical protein
MTRTTTWPPAGCAAGAAATKLRRWAGSALLTRVASALGLDHDPADSSEAFDQWTTWGGLQIGAMLIAALVGVGFYTVLPQAPVVLNIIVWLVVMAAPVYCCGKMCGGYFRYLGLRRRERARRLES